MRIMHISWEYPPRLYGGLGRHVHALAEHQAALGHQVSVVTQRPRGLPDAETVNGVQIVRVTPPTDAVPTVPGDLVDWAQALDRSLARAIADLGVALRPEVAHAHDWVVTQAALAARGSTPAVPLVSTIHATEGGRHQGWISNELSRTIHNSECALTAASERIIVCSRSMQREVAALFCAPASKIDVIANGIDLSYWQSVIESGSINQAPPAVDRGTVLFTGRIEWEKGVHVLLAAVNQIVDSRPDIRVLIAGTGTRQQDLRHEFSDLIEAGRVTFLGRVPEQDLIKLIANADVAVVPSIYEPFGLVALEAAALSTPLVVSDTGGLADLVDDGVTGRVVASQDVDALAEAILETLANRDAATKRAQRLRLSLSATYDWTTIAARTVESYRRAIQTHQPGSDPGFGPMLAAPADHNLLNP